MIKTIAEATRTAEMSFNGVRSDLIPKTIDRTIRAMTLVMANPMIGIMISHRRVPRAPMMTLSLFLMFNKSLILLGSGLIKDLIKSTTDNNIIPIKMVLGNIISKGEWIYFNCQKKIAEKIKINIAEILSVSCFPFVIIVLSPLFLRNKVCNGRPEEC